MTCSHAACDMRAVATLQSTGRGVEVVRQTVTVQVLLPGSLAFCRAHMLNAVSLALELWSL